MHQFPVLAMPVKPIHLQVEPVMIMIVVINLHDNNYDSHTDQSINFVSKKEYHLYILLTQAQMNLVVKIKT